MIKRLTCALLLVPVLVGPVLGHPGHGTTEGDSLAHYLFEPLHLGAAIGGATVVVGLAIVTRRAMRRSQRTRS